MSAISTHFLKKVKDIRQQLRVAEAEYVKNKTKTNKELIEKLKISLNQAWANYDRLKGKI